MAEHGALHRAARVLAAMFVVDAAAFLVVTFLWPRAVPLMFLGFALAWLTAVALVVVQMERGEFDKGTTQ